MSDIGNVVFETMLKEAVTANFGAKMNSMLSEEDLAREHPPSAGHIRKMDALFAMERRGAALGKLLASVKAAVLAILVAATLVLSVLMTNADVRAAVRDAIVQFFDVFTRIEFREPDTQPHRAAGDYSLGYVPDGYTLLSMEEYGSACMITYGDTAGNFIILDIGPPDTHAVDNEQTEYYTETRNGIFYHVFQATDAEMFSILIWVNDGFSFSLVGMVPVDELIRIAESIA